MFVRSQLMMVLLAWSSGFNDDINCEPTMEESSAHSCEYRASLSGVLFEGETVEAYGKIGIGDRFVYVVSRFDHSDDTTSFVVLCRDDNIVHAGHLKEDELTVTARFNSLDEWCESGFPGPLVAILESIGNDDERINRVDQFVTTVNSDDSSLWESIDVELDDGYSEPDLELLPLAIPELYEAVKDLPLPPKAVDSL